MSKTYKKLELTIPNQENYTKSRYWYLDNQAQSKIRSEEHKRQMKLSKK